MAIADDISVSSLVTKLWLRRGLIILLPFAMACVAIIAVLTMASRTPAVFTLHIELVGLEKGRYPNGSQFSPQDLLSPRVLEEAGARYGLAPTLLRDNIRVAFGTPLSHTIMAQYQASLNEKSRPEAVASLTEFYRSRLEDASSRGVSISVKYDVLGLSREKAAEITQLIPSLWNTLYAVQFNVMTNPEIVRQLASITSEELSGTSGMVKTERQLGTIQKSLAMLAQDSRFRLLRTEKNLTPQDLANEITAFRNIYFEPLYSETFDSSDPLGNVYRQNQLSRINEIELELTEINSVINQLTSLQSKSDIESENLSSPENAQAVLDENALGQLINLSRQASLAGYFQKNFEHRLSLIQEKSEIQSRLAKMATRMDARVASSELLPSTFKIDVESRLMHIESIYVALLEAATQLARSETPTFYKQVSSKHENTQWLNRRQLMIVAFAFVMGGVAAVCGALLLPKKT